MTTQVTHLRQMAQAAMEIHFRHIPVPARKVHVRHNNPQREYKRVKGPDGRFYVTPRSSEGPYQFVKGKRGKIGTKVSYNHIR